MAFGQSMYSISANYENGDSYKKYPLHVLEYFLSLFRKCYMLTNDNKRLMYFTVIQRLGIFINLCTAMDFHYGELQSLCQNISSYSAVLESLASLHNNYI